MGDIIGIYDESGNKVAGYIYDAWGNCTVQTYGNDARIGEVNPFRYRGYYFDSDIGLYYLKSRYYDAVTGRFINADSLNYFGANGDLGAYNLFAYCGCKPVAFSDPTGHAIDVVLDLISVGYDIYELATDDGYKDWTNWLALGIDVACCIVPVTTGGGVAVDIITKADDAIDLVNATNKVDNVADMATASSKIDFYITPNSEAIPSTRVAFDNNLSMMDNVGGKYVGADSQGPIRIRTNEIHVDKPGYKGNRNPLHTQSHFHIERRKNGETGKWQETYTGLMEMIE